MSLDQCFGFLWKNAEKWDCRSAQRFCLHFSEESLYCFPSWRHQLPFPSTVCGGPAFPPPHRDFLLAVSRQVPGEMACGLDLHFSDG